MSHAGEARTLARSGDAEGVIGLADETLREAQEVARLTLDEARVEAERIRDIARGDAARLRARARTDAKRHESKLIAIEAQVAALIEQVAALEAEGAGDRDGAQNVIARSRTGQVASVASLGMSGAPPSPSPVEKERARQRRLDAAAARQMADVDAERTQLRDEIAATKRRIEQIHSSGSQRPAVERELGAIVLAAYDELAAIEHDHRVSIDGVRSDARVEVARILEGAREQAAAIHARAAAAAELSDDDPQGWAPS